MKPQIATNPEQSNRLIACGVDLTTADMCWTQRTHRIDVYPIKRSLQKANLWLGYPCKRVLEDDEQRIDTPAWSLSAVIRLLPSGIKDDNYYFDEISNYTLLIYPYMQGWQVEYKYCKDDECHCLKCIHDAELVEACVRMIEWLIQNHPDKIKKI
ncbi:MAG: hypothetical protein NC453_26310 [Muribaculum sp.]|nr:hypothetical protein [Muribaculum sp.]